LFLFDLEEGEEEEVEEVDLLEGIPSNDGSSLSSESELELYSCSASLL